MNNPHKEYTDLRRRYRSYRRQARVSIVALAIAIGMLAVMGHQMLENRQVLNATREQLRKVTQQIDDAATLIEQQVDQSTENPTNATD